MSMSMLMCICIGICICMFMSMFVYVYLYLYMYRYMCMYMCMYINMHRIIYMCIYIYIDTQNVANDVVRRGCGISGQHGSCPGPSDWTLSRRATMWAATSEVGALIAQGGKQYLGNV